MTSAAWDTELVKLQRTRRMFIRFAQELNPGAVWSGDEDRRYGKTHDATGTIPVRGTVSNFGTYRNAVASYDAPMEVPSISTTLIDADNEWRALADRPSNYLLHRRIGYYLRQHDDDGAVWDELIALGRIKSPGFQKGAIQLGLDVPGGDFLGDVVGRRRVTASDWPRALPEHIDAVVPFVYGVLYNSDELLVETSVVTLSAEPRLVEPDPEHTGCWLAQSVVSEWDEEADPPMTPPLSYTLTFPKHVSQGSLLVAVSSYRAPAERVTTAVSDGQGNLWKSGFKNFYSLGGEEYTDDIGFHLWYAKAKADGPLSVTVTRANATGSRDQVLLFELPGVKSPPTSSGVSDTFNVTWPAPGAPEELPVATSGSGRGCLIACATFGAPVGTSSVSHGFHEVPGSNEHFAVAYKFISRETSPTLVFNTVRWLHDATESAMGIIAFPCDCGCQVDTPWEDTTYDEPENTDDWDPRLNYSATTVYQQKWDKGNSLFTSMDFFDTEIEGPDYRYLEVREAEGVTITESGRLGINAESGADPPGGDWQSIGVWLKGFGQDDGGGEAESGYDTPGFFLATEGWMECTYYPVENGIDPDEMSYAPLMYLALPGNFDQVLGLAWDPEWLGGSLNVWGWTPDGVDNYDEYFVPSTVPEVGVPYRVRVCWKCGTGVPVASDGYIKVFINDVLEWNATGIPLWFTDETVPRNKIDSLGLGYSGMIGEVDNIAIYQGACQCTITRTYTRGRTTPECTDDVGDRGSAGRGGWLKAMLVDTGGDFSSLPQYETPTLTAELLAEEPPETGAIESDQRKYYSISALYSGGDGQPLRESLCSPEVMVQLTEGESQTVRLTWTLPDDVVRFRLRRSTSGPLGPGDVPQPDREWELAPETSTLDDSNVDRTNVSPCPGGGCTNTGNPFYLLAGHWLKSVDEVFVLKPVVTTGENGEELTQDQQVRQTEGVDFRQVIVECNGNRYHCLEFFAKQRSDTCQYWEVTANVQGVETMADGTGILLTNTVDIFQHILLNIVFNTYRSSVGTYAPPGGRWFTDVPYSPGLVDAGSMAAAREATAVLNMVGAGALTDKIAARELIHELLTCYGLDFYQHLGVWYTTFFDPRAVVREALAHITPDGLIKDSFEPTLDDSRMVNVLPYFVGPLGGAAQGGYLISGEIRDEVSIGLYNRTMINEPVHLLWTQDGPTAYIVMDRYRQQFRFPLTGATLAAPIRWWAGIGQTVRITHPDGLGSGGWVERVCRVLAVDLDFDQLICHLTVRDIDDLVP